MHEFNKSLVFAKNFNSSAVNHSPTEYLSIKLSNYLKFNNIKNLIMKYQIKLIN